MSNASQHVLIYLELFPSNSTRKFKCSPFSTFVLHILASPGYVPGKIAVNVTRMEREFNAGQMHSSIYPSIFNRLRAIARYWSEIATFSYPLHLTPPLRVFPLEFRGKFGPQKLESWGYQAVKTVSKFDDRLSRFDTIPACDGRTDRRTDV